MIEDMEDNSLNEASIKLKEIFTRLLSNSEFVFSIKSSQRNDESAFSVKNKASFLVFYLKIVREWRHIQWRGFCDYGDR